MLALRLQNSAVFSAPYPIAMTRKENKKTLLHLPLKKIKKKKTNQKTARWFILISTSEQEACIAKSLKQLMTHCSISRPKASKVFTVDSRSPGFPEQQISILVSTFLLSTSNCKNFTSFRINSGD
jgi:hypothetical protein